MESTARVRGTLTEHKVIQEMIDTEKTYNETLLFLEIILTQEDLFQGIAVLDKLKKTLPILLDISNKLLNNVRDAIDFTIEPSLRNQLKEQRLQLLKAYFKIYPVCTQLYADYLIEEKKIPERFKEIKRLIKENNPNQLDLDSMLIQLVQRGPRYQILVAQAISYNEGLAEGQEGKLSEEKVADLKVLLQLIIGLLEDGNAKAPKLRMQRKSYRFGDLTLSLVNYLTGDEEEVKTSKEVAIQSAEDLKQGFKDLTHSIHAMWKSATSSRASTTESQAKPSAGHQS